MSNRELHERVLELRDLLVRACQGGTSRFDDNRYQELRAELMGTVIKDRLPNFVRRQYSLAEFWGYIKGVDPRWEPRRQHVRDEFAILLAELEGHAKSFSGASERQPQAMSSGGAPRLPRLRAKREEAEKKIRARIEAGRQILEMPLSSDTDLKAARSAEANWSKYNSDLLKKLFDSDAVSQEYDRWFGIAVARASFADKVKDFREDTLDSIAKLESVLGRLELFEEEEAPHTRAPREPVAPETVGNVFVVHGHDDALKESVARFLEKLQLNPIILHEQPNSGRTLIEKFEANATVGYAVVLMTRDDQCGTEGRPRQNVIFELGYFYGLLGRSRVAALVGEDVTRPSDFQGIVYIPLERGDWKIELAKELRAAGFEIDMNRVV